MQAEWFKQIPGFSFRDPDGDLVVFIGRGKWRKPVPVVITATSMDADRDGTPQFDLSNGVLNAIKFMPETLVGAYLYKNEWHMFDLGNQSKQWWDESTPEENK